MRELLFSCRWRVAVDPRDADMDITISAVAGSDLYSKYPHETSHQPCFVELDCRTGALSAEVDPEIGNARPFDVHYGHRIRWTIPALKAAVANALLEEISPLAARICEGYDTRWDGHNTVAELDADAVAAEEQIEALCERAGGEGDEVVVWQADDWYAVLGTMAVQAEDLGVTSESTDEQLAAIAEREAARAEAEGVDEIDGLRDYLDQLRESAREDAA